jgi:hypothetical protein
VAWAAQRQPDLSVARRSIAFWLAQPDVISPRWFPAELEPGGGQESHHAFHLTVRHVENMKSGDVSETFPPWYDAICPGRVDDLRALPSRS